MNLKNLTDKPLRGAGVGYRDAPCVVRNEYFGPLIWSGALGGYFMPRDSRDADLMASAVAAFARGELDCSAIEDSVARDFARLGLTAESRFMDAPGTDLSAPLEAYFDFTWACNLANSKCGQDSYCYAAPFLGPTTMSMDRISSVLEELYDWGVMRVHLAGGEPTTRPQSLLHYLRTAYRLGLMTSMSTNGTMLNDQLIEELLSTHPFSITFSIDGHEESTFAAVRGPGLFEKVKRNFERLRAARDSSGNQTILCIKPTIDPGTPRSTVLGLVDLAIGLGADKLKFSSPERCLHHDKGHYGSLVDEYYEMAFFLESIRDEFHDRIKIDVVNNPLAGGCETVGVPGRQGCIGAQELIAINPDGRISPCLMHNASLGRLGEDVGSLRDFWYGSMRLKQFREQLAMPSDCDGCSLHGSCRSGSVVRRIVEGGLFGVDKSTGEFRDRKDPLCPSDYLQRHPTREVSVKIEKPELTHFRRVVVAHSL